ncbi:ATP-dependent zinc protease family protein [Phycisphaera mikurensis]|uniref:Retropepsin-like aspartic endopeptidase domain-containing protein n=1 Tax=Phycisphaera mikurensis (strain NBRC 102666 / KCTC 22515 / FYK2301M01) TaxID=1142394 RepID=I0IAW3_PHYMF|nr:RimK/LysX family protein [Phycisphaera mikurensis]MBB6442625.1 hypothetical protein [Phycisphaera mikurensis]BAM02401.1 hypothetical protein PSMK_02420 [Phycisphaera mikurensis NBRC 102666]
MPEPPPKPCRIGWRERVALPDLHIRGMLAKADTGARTGAIDVVSFEELPGERVRFRVALSREDRTRTRELEAPIRRRSGVKSAHGKTQQRLFIETTLVLAGITKTIELSLAKRADLRHRLLLGRAALSPEFLVDSGRTFVVSTPHRRG